MKTLTAKDAAIRAGVCRATIYRWISESRCVATKTAGGQWRIEADSLPTDDLFDQALLEDFLARDQDVVDHSPSPDQLAMLKEAYEALGEMFAKERDASIARRRIFFGDTLQDVADSYGLSQSRVQHIEARALRRLIRRAAYTKGASERELKLAQDRERLRNAGPPPRVQRQRSKLRRAQARRQGSADGSWTIPLDHHSIGVRCIVCTRRFVVGARVKTKNVGGVGYLVHALCYRTPPGSQNPRPIHGRPGVFEDPETGEQFCVKGAKEFDVYEIAKDMDPLP